jgi:hypothetical protein
VCKGARMSQRRSFRSSFLSVLGVSLVLGAVGCDKTDPPIPDESNDLAVKPADLSHGHNGDMATAAGDMAVATSDMAGGDMAGAGPKLMGVPTCTDTGVTAEIVFNSVAKANCANGRCHSTGAGYLGFMDGATMKTAMVGKKSGQSMLDIVKASNIDQSYVLYKLMDQHMVPGVAGRGELMPKGGSKLANADLCKFIVWVKEGAK